MYNQCIFCNRIKSKKGKQQHDRPSVLMIISLLTQVQVAAELKFLKQTGGTAALQVQ